MTHDPPTVRTALLALLVATSVVAGAVALSGPGAASLSGATATDVVGGLSDVSQTISVRGQATEDGATNYYEVDLSDIVTSGASVRDVAFRNVGYDDDSLANADQPLYSPSTHTITFTATEDARDVDAKIDFRLVVTFDTTGLRKGGEHRYTVTQYEDSGSDVTLSPQAAQFKVVGAKNLKVDASKPTTNALDVTHEATHTMTQRVRGVTYVSIHTDGAGYNNLTAGDVTVTKNGGADLTSDDTAGIRVSNDGATVLVPLDWEQTFHRDDRVRVTLHNVSNPPTDSHFTVAFRTDEDTPVYVASGRLEMQAACLNALQRGGNTGASVPGLGLAGGALALLLTAFAIGRRT